MAADEQVELRGQVMYGLCEERGIDEMRRDVLMVRSTNSRKVRG